MRETVRVNGVMLFNVHRQDQCRGEACCIHNPSDHHMKTWALDWRDDIGRMERLCAHGVGHPDPDAVAFRERSGQDADTVHGCDGCCQPLLDLQPLPVESV